LNGKYFVNKLSIFLRTEEEEIVYEIDVPVIVQKKTHLTKTMGKLQIVQNSLSNLDIQI
jgi:O-methyltransferase involved in polyketide biosynthesis